MFSAFPLTGSDHRKSTCFDHWHIHPRVQATCRAPSRGSCVRQLMTLVRTQGCHHDYGQTRPFRSKAAWVSGINRAQ